ncbi:hypothetical protein ACFLUZ_03035 [Chloroflexota bacterium]
MRYKVKEVSEKLKPEVECHHYWLIEGAKGPISRGVCKLCGTEKEFLNSLPVMTPVKGRHNQLFDMPELPDVELDERRSS